MKHCFVRDTRRRRRRPRDAASSIQHTFQPAQAARGRAAAGRRVRYRLDPLGLRPVGQNVRPSGPGPRCRRGYDRAIRPRGPWFELDGKFPRRRPRPRRRTTGSRTEGRGTTTRATRRRTRGVRRFDASSPGPPRERNLSPARRDALSASPPAGSVAISKWPEPGLDLNNRCRCACGVHLGLSSAAPFAMPDGVESPDFGTYNSATRGRPSTRESRAAAAERRGARCPLSAASFQSSFRKLLEPQAHPRAPAALTILRLSVLEGVVGRQTRPGAYSSTAFHRAAAGERGQGVVGREEAPAERRGGGRGGGGAGAREEVAAREGGCGGGRGANRARARGDRRADRGGGRVGGNAARATGRDAGRRGHRAKGAGERAGRWTRSSDGPARRGGGQPPRGRGAAGPPKDQNPTKSARRTG